MPLPTGTCQDCGKTTSKITTRRCQPCNMKTRRGKGNWPPKRKTLKKKTCPVCGNINHLNFNQEKIWKMKEAVALFKQQYVFHYGRLKIVRGEHRRIDRKIERATKFHDKLLAEISKELSKISRTEKEVRKMLQPCK